MNEAGLGWLYARLTRGGDQPALVWNDEVVTYRALARLVDDWTPVLDREGIRQGHVVVVLGDYYPRAVALLIALMVRRCVVVPLSRVVARQRERYGEIAEADFDFDFHDDVSPVVTQRHRSGSAHPLLQQLRARPAAGLVLFTSGSTGESKAALHDLEALLERHRSADKPLRTIIFLLFDHIGGINTLFYVLASLGTAVIVRERGVDAVCRAVERHAVDLLPVSPTFLNMLMMSDADARYRLDSLRMITYGTEPMPQALLAQVHERLPRVTLKQTYGLSELGILQTKSRDSGSLWMKVGSGDTATKVVDGVLWIRAPSAMLGYLNHENPFDAEGWFNTKDLVEVDGDYLRILGRTTDIINVGGEKVFPAEVENVIMTAPNIVDVVVRGKKSPVTGQIVTAVVALEAPEDPDDVADRVIDWCRSRLEPFKVPLIVEITNEKLHTERHKKQR